MHTLYLEASSQNSLGNMLATKHMLLVQLPKWGEFGLNPQPYHTASDKLLHAGTWEYEW